MSRSSQALLTDYLARLHELGAELSISSELAEVSAAVRNLADRSGDAHPARADEPYRRAITGIYARLAATYESLTGRPPARPASVRADPYPDARQLCSDLMTLERSLKSEAQGSRDDVGALTRLIRAVETFGFHLATLDLRQNADVHARVVADLLKVAGVADSYESLAEPQRVALLREELASQRLLASPYATYSEETLSELAIVLAAAEAQRALRRGLHHDLHRVQVRSVSDLLEVNILLKEAGLYSGSRTTARSHHGRAAVRDHRRSASAPRR